MLMLFSFHLKYTLLLIILSYYTILKDEPYLQVSRCLQFTPQLPSNPFVDDLKSADRSQALHRLIGMIVRESRSDGQVGTLIAIDDAHYVDSDSWSFLKDLVSDSTIIAFSVSPHSKDRFSEDALKILENPQTKQIQLRGLEHNCMEPLLCQLLEVGRVPRELTK